MERLTVPAKKLDDGRMVMPIIDGRAVREHAMDFYWRLKEYEDLEEQGLLLRLPCKVGDAVYSCECGLIVRDFVHSFSTDANGLWAINMYGGIIGLFGLSVFTTLAEAEKKLAEMGE